MNKVMLVKFNDNDRLDVTPLLVNKTMEPIG